jgi:hypothetical protein
MKLLREVNQEVNIITECVESTGAKKYFIEGIFIQCEKPNRNGRKYKKDWMSEEIDRYNSEYVSKNRAFGELGHPENPTINLDRVSHLIVSLVPEGNNYIGKARILDTPNGNIVKAFIDADCTLGVSTRGLGSLQSEGQYSIVQPDYKIMTAADIVADPSAQEAFVEAVMESKEWIYENGKFLEVQVEEWKNRINKSSGIKLPETKLNVFKDFLSKL